MSAYADTEYIRYDPFDGDRDVDVRARTVAIVTTRKPHKCMSPGGAIHDIPSGTRARYETAIVEGHWGRYYTCVACMDGWLRDFCHLPTEEPTT